MTLSLACDQGTSVEARMQDYKSLCAAVAICCTLVNIQTHSFTYIETALDQLICQAQPAALKQLNDDKIEKKY